jgi:hypothetical protein
MCAQTDDRCAKLKLSAAFSLAKNGEGEGWEASCIAAGCIMAFFLFRNCALDRFALGTVRRWSSPSTAQTANDSLRSRTSKETL